MASFEPRDALRHREKKRFTQDGQKFQYDIYDANGPPPIIFGRVGDVAEDGERVWYRENTKWEVASKEVDHIGRPIQKHPVCKSNRRLEGVEWKAQATWNTRKRKLDELHGVSHLNSVEQPTIHAEITCPGSKYGENSHVTKDFVAPVRPENSWILELRTLWTSPPISSITPIKSIGFDILQVLIYYPHILPKSPSDNSTLLLLEKPSKFSSSPTLGHVIRDLIHPDNHNVFDFVNQYGDPDVEYPEFILSMLRAGEGHAWDDSRRLYGALNIRESDIGIGSCHLDALPYSQEQESLVDKDGWASTWTPPGAISHTHMDFYGSMQYFIHFYGKKLWLLWPPTPRNLEWFSSQHKQRANGNRVLDCIHHLEGLQLHYVDNSETFFVLKPNTLHACISFTSSGHTGIQVWSLDHFDESCRMMEWGIQWLKTGFYSTLGQSRVELLEEADTLKEEVDTWHILAKRNPKHPSTVGVKEKVKGIMQRLSEVRSLINVPPRAPKPSCTSKGRKPLPKGKCS
ncbi:hypothetical protein GALMADRAFT_215162 [Galerina marginata CBS 339.88]|uniref:JmjC domain-containing protein n=1 Tax=Galerina marginata (strain CBS 339.88) TaxID=685588 RepID=A0A067SHN4_GALM3|nr:hypothetical protein GALMADRAFT_215162 [Galerina marginata CBS 339.88]